MRPLWFASASGDLLLLVRRVQAGSRMWMQACWLDWPALRTQLLASIRESIYRRSLPLATRNLLIQRSSLGGLAGVIGASGMVVDQLFSRESLAQLTDAEPVAGVELPELVLAGVR